MGDLIDLQSRIAQAFDAGEAPGFEEFLATEGLTLLAEFRSIEDTAVRASILKMVSDMAAALRSQEARLNR